MSRQRTIGSALALVALVACADSERTTFGAKTPLPPRATVAPGVAPAPDAPWRSNAPSVSPAGETPLPNLHEIVLANGMHAVFVEKRGMPIVTIRSAVHFGIDDVTPLSLAFFSTGTPSRPSEVLSQVFHEMGAERNVRAGLTTVDFDVKVTSPNASAALVRIADVLQNATCKREDLAEAKRLGMGSLAGQRSNAVLRGAVDLDRLVDPGQKSLEQVRAALQSTSLADADQAFHQHVTPERTLLVIAGDFQTAELEAEVRKRFTGWSRKSAPLTASRVVSAPTTARTLLVDNPGASQADIFVGAWAPDADEHVRKGLFAIDELLGGGMSGRLGDATREHLGVTYGANASYVRHRTHGVFAVSGAFETGRAVIGLTSTLNAIQSLIDQPFSVAEIKDAHTRSSARSFATSDSIAATLSPWVRTADREPLPAFMARTFQPSPSSPEELQKIAATYLSREHLQIVIVGGAKRLTSPLLAAGVTPTETVPY